MKIRFFIHFILGLFLWLITIGLSCMLVMEVVLPIFNIYEDNDSYDLMMITIIGFNTIVSAVAFTYYFTSPLYFLKEWIDNLSENNYYIPQGNFKIYNRKNELKRNYKLYDGVIENISRLSDNLKKSEEEKAQLEEMKKNWIAGISHDLKTPLTYITGYSALLMDKTSEYTEEEKDSFLKEISDKSNEISEMLEDLNLSMKLDSTKLPLKLEKVNIVNFIRDIIVGIGNNPKACNHDFTFDSEEEEIYIQCDKKFIRRVLENLIMNSVIHNPAHTKIETKIIIENDNIDIFICDNGTGMDKKTLDNIFDKYYQGNAGKNRNGSGLGMFIAKELIEANNGSIQVKSQISKGTEFCIKFPFI